MLPKNKTDEFSTSDLYLAAYLQTAGVELVRNEREGSRVYFIFDTSVSNIEELKLGWVSNSAKIPAQPFANAIKSLKSVCHMG